jgi:hypothetical protein
MTNDLKPRWRKENNKGIFRIPTPALPEGKGAQTGLMLVLSLGKEIRK